MSNAYTGDLIRLITSQVRRQNDRASLFQRTQKEPRWTVLPPTACAFFRVQARLVLFYVEARCPALRPQSFGLSQLRDCQLQHNDARFG
jgi:hypothetical protein